MAIIIFTGEELTFKHRMGHAIRVTYDDDKNVQEHSEPGRTFPGSPTCVFCSKTIPDLVTYSKKGPTLSEILKQTFEHVDKLGVWAHPKSQSDGNI